jgi:hypothetical protein
MKAIALAIFLTGNIIAQAINPPKPDQLIFVILADDILTLLFAFELFRLKKDTQP